MKQSISLRVTCLRQGKSGVLKKRTDDTMTTTRLRELVTEWVTGDTLANKLYETCQETRFKKKPAKKQIETLL